MYSKIHYQYVFRTDQERKYYKYVGRSNNENEFFANGQLSDLGLQQIQLVGVSVLYRWVKQKNTP